MRRFLGLSLLATLWLLPACGSGPGVVYTGEEEDAAEGAFIKDPEAVGQTGHKVKGSQGQRTESNRVDIPLIEFAQLRIETTWSAAKSRIGLNSTFTRGGYAAFRCVGGFDRRLGQAGLYDVSSAEWLHVEAGRLFYAATKSGDQVNARAGSARYGAASSSEMTRLNATSDETMAFKSREGLNAARAEAGLSAARSNAGYGALRGERVIGLRLWKYADREIVANSVEITYTIVYYNTNEYAVGATEVDEPVPFYTEYMQGSATTPKDGVTVEFIKREGGRNILRWKFPKGIEAGETNKMTYRVTVRLEEPYAPKGEVPAQPSNQ